MEWRGGELNGVEGWWEEEGGQETRGERARERDCVDELCDQGTTK